MSINFLRYSVFFIVLIQTLSSCSNKSDKDIRKENIENLSTYARLYGYLRYFHPSDESAQIDWDLLAIYGAQKVASASNIKELQSALNEVFDPISPSLEILSIEDSTDFNLTRIIPQNIDNLDTIFWQHLGYGVHMSLYKSVRKNRKVYRKPINELGSYFLETNIDSLKGQSIKIRAKGKVDINNTMGIGHIFAKVYDGNSKLVEFISSSSNRIIDYDWTTIEVDVNLKEESQILQIGFGLRGSGKCWFDEIQILTKSEDSWQIYYEENFNSGSNEIYEGNYKGDINKFHKGETVDIDSINKAFMISSFPIEIDLKSLFDDSIEFGTYIEKPIGNGLKCRFPLVLLGDSSKTFPVANNEKLMGLIDSLSRYNVSNLSGDDLFVRLGNTINAWNVFQHFYPYFNEVDVDWPKVLEQAISKCYADKSELDFRNTLKWLVAKLQDGHGLVHLRGLEEHDYILPILLKSVENQWVVSKVLDNSININVGDILTAVNDVSILKLYEEQKGYISGPSERELRNRFGVELIREGKGDSLKLTLEDHNGVYHRKVECTMTRGDYYGKLDETQDEFNLLQNGVYYFNMKSPGFIESFEDKLPELLKANAIILDLRGYPSPGAHEILPYLMTETDSSKPWRIPHILFPDQERVENYRYSGWNGVPQEPHLNAKVILLTDIEAISYSESIISLFKHYKLATIVGEPTTGTNGNVNVIVLPGGYYIRWTGMHVSKHDGSQHHGIGVVPDIIVRPTINGIRDGRDEVLERAIEIAMQN